MSKIKSEKAKDFIMSIVEPTPTPNGELIFYVEMTPLQVVEAIIIAETELTEHYEQQLQELRDRAIKLFHDTIKGMCIGGIDERLKKEFTQKLTEKQ